MLYCGVSQHCITPKSPVYLAGYAARWGKQSVGVHDDLFVKAFYFEAPGVKLLMMFADLEGIPEQVLLPVKNKILEHIGVSYVCISATHTHSAPHTYKQVQLDHEELNEDWLKSLQDALFIAAQEAVQSKFSAKIGYGLVQADEVARNRRKGHEETDPEMCVLHISDTSDCVRGILMTYSCHCTVLDASSFLVSADYPGYIYQLMNIQFPDAITAFSNGAAGDINIGYSCDASALGEAMDIRTFKNAKRIAGLLCDKAMACMKNIQMHSDISIKVDIQKVTYPLRQDMPSEDSLRKKIYEIDGRIASASSEETVRDLKLRKIYLQCFILRMRTNLMGGNVLQADSMFIQIGHLLYVTIPGELFTKSGLQIKKYFNRCFDTIILGYSNGYIGYIPSKEAMDEGGYESETSIFANDVADQLIRQLKEAEICRHH